MSFRRFLLIVGLMVFFDIMIGLALVLWAKAVFTELIPYLKEFCK